MAATAPGCYHGRVQCLELTDGMLKMGQIRKTVWVVGRRGRKKVEALFDTGASYSLLREDVARAIGEPEELPEPRHFEAAVGGFTARFGIFADLLFQRKRFHTALTVAPGLTEDLLIGTDFMQQFHVRLEPRKRRVSFDKQALRLLAVGSRLRRRGRS